MCWKKGTTAKEQQNLRANESVKRLFKNSGEYMTKSPSYAIAAYGSIFNKILLKFYKLF